MARIDITYNEYVEIVLCNPYSSEYHRDGYVDARRGIEYNNPHKLYSFEWLEYVDGYLDYCDFLKRSG